MSKEPIHVMVDLETLDTASTAAIVSIGAVAFDMEEGILDRFYKVVSLDNACKHGTISGGSLKFWLNQPDVARKEITGGSEYLCKVLQDFNSWIRELTRDPVSKVCDTSRIRLWGNGADFDISILLTAFNSFPIPAQWKFYHHRCYRTIARQYPQHKRPKNPTPHNALLDAECQVMHLLRICEVEGLDLK